MFNCCAGRIEKSLRNRGKQPIQLFFLSRFCLRIHPVRGRRRRGLDFYPRMGSGEWRYFSPLRPPRGEPPTSLARGRAQPREEEKGGKMQKYCQRALRLLRPLALRAQQGFTHRSNTSSYFPVWAISSAKKGMPAWALLLLPPPPLHLTYFPLNLPWALGHLALPPSPSSSIQGRKGRRKT